MRLDHRFKSSFDVLEGARAPFAGCALGSDRTSSRIQNTRPRARRIDSRHGVLSGRHARSPTERDGRRFSDGQCHGNRDSVLHQDGRGEQPRQPDLGEHPGNGHIVAEVGQGIRPAQRPVLRRNPRQCESDIRHRRFQVNPRFGVDHARQRQHSPSRGFTGIDRPGRTVQSQGHQVAASGAFRGFVGA